MPELEHYILHRLSVLSARVHQAAIDYDWTGVVPDIHAFCASDLSAFYFDIRKDSLYCDRPDSSKRRAARTVLDHLHRCLCTWLAPVLCFTAEEAWTARFGEDSSVHLQGFATASESWADPALAAKWEGVRSLRGEMTTVLEEARRSNLIGSSLQARLDLTLPASQAALLPDADWADIAIVSGVAITAGEAVAIQAPRAPGEKCARCWRVLEEVGSVAAHPTLCLRCTDAVDSGLVCASAA